jgi:LuxR family transcriptional regulator, maltose regulon positive regulatory protein
VLSRDQILIPHRQMSGMGTREDRRIGGKQPQLLTTKILPPRGAAGLIERPRLLALIAQLEEKQLTVIKAAAGFGKTSLALAWAEHLRERGNSVGWLALDPDDNEPTRFLFYVAHALRRACDGVGEAAISQISEFFFLIPVNAIVATLTNELADSEDEIYLFLDDYHWIADRKIHDALSFLLLHAPSQFHLVLTTRTEPALPLTQLRAQNRLLEIDGGALRFDLDETRRFLEHENFPALDPSEVGMLCARTEGWPAVLRIIAATSSQPGQDFAQYVRRLSGSWRPIDAYLAEMLDGLPGDVVGFMVRTAILDRLCVPLCQAVTLMDASQDLLKSIEVRQLLLMPLDQEGQWYRYHPLLSGHLKQRLETNLGGEIPELHRRAYRWYASQELWTDAVNHAIAAGDTDQAVNWIEICAMRLVKIGDLITLLGWQSRFPAELMHCQVKVRLASAWGMALAMRFEEALQLLGQIEQDVGKTQTLETEALGCECRTVRSVVATLKDDSQTALAIAETCVHASADLWTLNVASNVTRFGYWKAGDLESFYATPWIAYSDEENRANVFSSIYRLCFQGLVELEQLRLSAAEGYYLDAMRLAERHVGPNSVAAAFPASLIAEIRYEQGRLDEAEATVIDRFPIINATGMLECVLCAYIVTARIAACRENIQRAYALLEQAVNLGETRQWGRLVAAVLVERLRLNLLEGRITEGSACVNRLERLATTYPAPTRCAWSAISYYVALARAQVARAENRLGDADPILAKLHHEAETTHNDYAALRLGTQRAAVLLSANQPAEASRVFRTVLSTAASAGIYQTILDQGSEIGTLLLVFQEDAERTGRFPELLPYVASLIARWRERYQPGGSSSSSGVIAESLSPRERSIIELIGQGQSNKEIARNLSITPETVKSHVKNIFGKLGVQRRAQAVSRAQSLGLVTTR